MDSYGKKPRWKDWTSPAMIIGCAGVFLAALGIIVTVGSFAWEQMEKTPHLKYVKHDGEGDVTTLLVNNTSESPVILVCAYFTVTDPDALKAIYERFPDKSPKYYTNINTEKIQFSGGNWKANGTYEFFTMFDRKQVPAKTPHAFEVTIAFDPLSEMAIPGRLKIVYDDERALEHDIKIKVKRGFVGVFGPRDWIKQNLGKSLEDIPRAQ